MKNAAPPQKKESSNRYQLDCDGKLHALISFFFPNLFASKYRSPDIFLVFWWPPIANNILSPSPFPNMSETWSFTFLIRSLRARYYPWSFQTFLV